MANTSLKSQQSIAGLPVFHEIACALTSSLDLEAVLASIMRQMERFFHPETWTLLLADEQRKDLYYAIADGRFGPQLAEIRVPFGEGMAGWVAEHGETLILPEIADGTRLDAHLGFKVHSAVCIPLRSKLRTLGVIQLFNSPADTFSEYAISFLLVLCDFAAIAIENARAFEQVQELTITDECTGLYNVRHLQSTLQAELARCERLKTPMSLIFIDLDHFKLVNDQYGHQVGSRLLAEVSGTIKSQVRNIDLVFRYGGDEFVVLLPATIKRRAIDVANRLLQAFRRTNHQIPPALSLNIRASFGVSSYPDDGRSAHDLLRAADSSMYEVKGGSRDGVSYSPMANSIDQPA